jgi:N-formylglutamate deformylase
MDTTCDFTDDAYLEAFLACRLPPSAFNHRNHLRVAWIHLQRFPLDEAIERTCAAIARYAAHLGVPDRYHRTMTEALIRLMARAGASDPSLSFEGFLARAPAFSGDCRTLIAAHYSPGLLASTDARERFSPPDRLPLPS